MSCDRAFTTNVTPQPKPHRTIWWKIGHWYNWRIKTRIQKWKDHRRWRRYGRRDRRDRARLERMK